MKLHDLSDDPINTTLEYLAFRFPHEKPFYQTADGFIHYGRLGAYTLATWELEYYRQRAQAWADNGRHPKRAIHF